MGSIKHIYNPKNWKVVKEGKSKITPNDYIYKMAIGWCDDEISSGEIYEFISKENYDNLLNGNYYVKIFPYSEKSIIIFDKDNNFVPLVKGQIDKESIEKNPKKILKY